MKSLPVVLFSCFVLSSCSEFTKQKEEPAAPNKGRAIPAPSGYTKTEKKAAQPENELPSLASNLQKKRRKPPSSITTVLAIMSFGTTSRTFLRKKT